MVSLGALRLTCWVCGRRCEAVRGAREVTAWVLAAREICAEATGVGELNHLGARDDGVELKEGSHQRDWCTWPNQSPSCSTCCRCRSVLPVLRKKKYPLRQRISSTSPAFLLRCSPAPASSLWRSWSSPRSFPRRLVSLSVRQPNRTLIPARTFLPHSSPNSKHPQPSLDLSRPLRHRPIIVLAVEGRRGFTST